MNDARLYGSANGLPRRDAETVIEQYIHMIKWNQERDAKILDIGCGDGSVMTKILIPNLPGNCVITGVDISDEMIEHATREYSNSRVKFKKMDLSVELGSPQELYDHAFSFYCLNWIREQRVALQNIHSLLKEGGDCLMNIMANNPVFDIYKLMKKLPKWEMYMKDSEDFISAYHEIADPQEYIKKMLQQIGFRSIHVECKEWTYLFKGIQIFKNSMFAINPFLKRISCTLYDDFFEDYIAFSKDLGMIEENSKLDDEVIVKMEYTSLIVYARK